jgi:hypothetical protein
MTKLILIDARKMEKLLLKLGFRKVRQKGVMFFTDILMEGIPQFPIIKEEFWLVH